MSEAGISRAPQASARCLFFPSLRWIGRPVPGRIRTIIIHPPTSESSRKKSQVAENVLGGCSGPRYPETYPMQQEVVEASGHLIDSHVMEQIFDTVVECKGRFEVEQFRIGRTNAESSYLRLKLETAQSQEMEQLLGQLLGLGCTPVDTGDATLATVERDCCAPEDFYSTTNHHTEVRHADRWV